MKKSIYGLKWTSWLIVADNQNCLTTLENVKLQTFAVVRNVETVFFMGDYLASG
jgi:hypothetical protein